MTRDRSSDWIGIADFLLCCLGVVIVAVNPVKAKVDGVKPKAEYLIQMTYTSERDVDLDLWLATPSHAPVFYNSRQAGCVDLDRDSLGFNTQMIVLADGSTVRAREAVETISVRCIEPGRYDSAVNLFSWRTDSSGEPIKAHIEVTALNPTVRTVWEGDVTLKTLGETQNAVSFELDKEGHVSLVSVPLEAVTAAYEKAKPGGAP